MVLYLGDNLIHFQAGATKYTSKCRAPPPPMLSVSAPVTMRHIALLAALSALLLSHAAAGPLFLPSSDSVKPAIPSILKDHSSTKGAGGHLPPRSPKEKVTFAEFNDIVDTCGETSSDIKVTEYSSCLDVPSEINGKVIILESLKDTKSSQSQGEETERLLCQNTPD